MQKKTKSMNAYKISGLNITPRQAVTYHRKEANKSLKDNNYRSYRYHASRVAKINGAIILNRMKGTKPANQKGQLNVGTLVLIGLVLIGFILLLMGLNSFVGGEQLNLFQFIGTPLIWGIGAMAITGIIAFYVNQQFNIFGGNGVV